MFKHEQFTHWAKSRDVEIDGVEPSKIPGRGLGLVTTKPIREGTRVLSIPDTAMFKSDARLLKAHGVEEASPHAQLAFSVMARFQPADSPLKLWKETWPSVEAMHGVMPLHWPAELQNRMPPSAAVIFSRQRNDFEKDRDAVRHACTKLGYAESDFLYYWLIVNSRSFHWKPPRARAARSMVLCPFVDYMNHGPSGSTVEVLQRPTGYEVMTTRDYETGQEILATYGAHSNDKLLVHYGFVCDTSPNVPNRDDSIGLDHLLTPTFSVTVKTRLQNRGFLNGYVLSPADNELCFKTQVAVRAALLSSSEWEYYVNNGEDMGDDKSRQVRAYVEPLLRKYFEQASREAGVLDELASRPELARYEGGISILGTRWLQIRDALEAFLGLPQ